MPSIKFRSGSNILTYCPWRVGDLLFSTTATNPNVEWPGTTWALYAQDRFPVGAGSSYALGNTGGAASVTLSVAQMPSHTHVIQGYHNVVQQREGWAVMPCISNEYINDPAGGQIARATGGGGSHENRPPYIAVNIWRRTA